MNMFMGLKFETTTPRIGVVYVRRKLPKHTTSDFLSVETTSCWNSSL